MTQISTISELLKLSNSKYRIFDIGRVVQKIAKQDFEKVEQAMQPYPYPIQGHACFAIAFWQEQKSAPYLWFVKLPLDERGLLNQGSRNHYLAIILEALGSDLTQDPTEKQEELLQANPYNFTPSQYKLATLNALIKRDLKQNASEYYEHCQLYMSGKLGLDNWQGVGVQGIADFAARIDDKQNAASLIDNLAMLPEQVFNILCGALENHPLPIDLLTKVIALAKEEIAQQDVDFSRLSNLLRAMSANAENPLLVQFITDILNNEQLNNLNLLVTISGRCYPALIVHKQLMAFLEKLVTCVGQEIFVAVFKDLIAIPKIRPTLMQCIRDPQRSDVLGNAIGQLFNQVKN
ncbi:DUF3549 family protein [Thalassotalea crassostreae]|uniref:DUF3549 family protein n=1 Tax=Thalassotalea crassostreae TaxID=1763536 RepID=UPI000838D04D|nr:DUF3549 family protein [Thalassotalea crassostreae]